MFHKSILLSLLLILCCLAVYAESVGDNGSLISDEGSGKYQLLNTYLGTGYNIVQFKLATLSHYSYLVVSEGKVLAVDPGRDVEDYLAYASREKLEWAGTLLTHTHSDFISGHRELEYYTGTPVFAGHGSEAQYPHSALKEDDTIIVGSAVLRIIETPGHTAESLCAVVCPASNLQQQQFIFTGDTLLIGSLGLPDLISGSYSVSKLAGMMFDTWQYKLSQLSDNVVILPAHSNLCAHDSRTESSSTIGHEKTANKLLKHSDSRSAFIAAVLADFAFPPGYFEKIAKINQMGPERVDWKNPLQQRLTSLEGLIEHKDVYIVDVRSAKDYAQKHLPRSLHISLDNRLEFWVGALVPFHARLILTGHMPEILAAARRLKRIGYNAEYILFEDYLAGGEAVANTTMLEAVALHREMLAGSAPVVVDVRCAADFEKARLDAVANIPLSRLEKEAAILLNRDEALVVFANSAQETSMAISLLKRAGFKNVQGVTDGMEGWVAAGLPVIAEHSGKKELLADLPNKKIRSGNLPERLVPAQLRQMLKDLPDQFVVVDIRPSEQVRDYNPLGATAVTIVDLFENATWHEGEQPLVVVDRDGSMAMLVAGMLTCKTRRPIKVLLGGLEAYWREIEAGFMHKLLQKPASDNLRPAQGSHSLPAAAPESKGVIRSKKFKKGAGC